MRAGAAGQPCGRCRVVERGVGFGTVGAREGGGRARWRLGSAAVGRAGGRLLRGGARRAHRVDAWPLQCTPLVVRLGAVVGVGRVLDAEGRGDDVMSDMLLDAEAEGCALRETCNFQSHGPRTTCIPFSCDSAGRGIDTPCV